MSGTTCEKCRENGKYHALDDTTAFVVSVKKKTKGNTFFDLFSTQLWCSGCYYVFGGKRLNEMAKKWLKKHRH